MSLPVIKVPCSIQTEILISHTVQSSLLFFNCSPWTLGTSRRERASVLLQLLALLSRPLTNSCFWLPTTARSPDQVFLSMLSLSSVLCTGGRAHRRVSATLQTLVQHEVPGSPLDQHLHQLEQMVFFGSSSLLGLKWVESTSLAQQKEDVTALLLRGPILLFQKAFPL